MTKGSRGIVDKAKDDQGVSGAKMVGAPPATRINAAPQPLWQALIRTRATRTQGGRRTTTTQTTTAATLVSKVAGIAAHEVSGVYDPGGRPAAPRSGWRPTARGASPRSWDPDSRAGGPPC
jgi:hypothetical protein